MTEERRRDTDARGAFEIAERAAENAIRKFGPQVVDETLTRLGINARDPIGMQRQMSYLAEAAERANNPDVLADRSWTRQNRVRCEKVKEAAFSKGAQIVVGVVAVLLLAGLAAKIGIKIPT